MTNQSQPLSGAAQPAPQQYAFDRYRDGKLMAEGVRVSACSEVEARQKAMALFHPWDKRDTLQLRHNPAAPVAVPAEPRQMLGNRFPMQDRYAKHRDVHDEDESCALSPKCQPAPAPLPPPQEPMQCEHEFEEVCIRCGKSIFAHIKEQQ